MSFTIFVLWDLALLRGVFKALVAYLSNAERDTSPQSGERLPPPNFVGGGVRLPPPPNFVGG